ncbi:MAG: hypothetical protein GXO09_05590, partial [Crenarchaeota archaeon]|nr:hypothetical protein [Thermoproteota archaeon]
GGEVEGLYYRALIRSVELASASRTPVCQDTGSIVLIVESAGGRGYGELLAELEGAVERAERQGLLRPNRVEGVLAGAEYTGSRATLIPAEQRGAGGGLLRATLLLRGGGAEYYSRSYCLATHRAARSEAWRIVEEVLREADGKPCPPLILAVGAGPSIAEAARQAYIALAGIGGWRDAKPPKPLQPSGRPLPVKPRLLRILARASPSHPACTCLTILTQCWALRGARITEEKPGVYRVEPL